MQKIIIRKYGLFYLFKIKNKVFLFRVLIISIKYLFEIINNILAINDSFIMYYVTLIIHEIFFGCYFLYRI